MFFSKFLKNFAFMLLLAAQSVVCAPEWYTAADGRKYYIDKEYKYNWFQAANICARKNLQLAEIETEDKNEALVALLKDVFGKSLHLWLGANDEFNRHEKQERAFYWVSTGKPLRFSYFPPSQPDNLNKNEHCLHIFGRYADFKWNDVHCTSTFGFICEPKTICDLNVENEQIYGVF